LLAGVAGVLFTRVLYAVEDGCDRVWRGPSWARPAVGGLVLGALLLALPHLYGVGYPVLQDAVEGRYTLALLLVLLLGKMVATSLTIGIGGSGGVFAPSLFCGAMLGAAFGDVVHLALPGSTGSVGAYALVGMGAVFAGAARAPITAVLILFEITGEYSIILPLMLAIVVATAVSRLLSHDTVYTLKLRRRGVDMDSPHPRPVLSDRTVGDVMDPVPPALSGATDVRSAARQLLATGRQALPVVREDGVVVGLLSSRVAAEVLADDLEAETSTARQLAESPATVRPATPLGEALDVLLHADPAGVPVLDEEKRLAGWLTHQGVLRALAPGGPPRPATARTARSEQAGGPAQHGHENRRGEQQHAQHDEHGEQAQRGGRLAATVAQRGEHAASVRRDAGTGQPL
jgi:CIC family chloride channel protein